MNIEDIEQIIQVLLVIQLINAEDFQDALDILRGSQDPRACIDKLYEEIIPVSDRKGAMESLLRDKKIRAILSPEVHIHFLKYQMADYMAQTSEKDLSILEENLRKALVTSRNWR